MTFIDLPEGQTHSENDGCGEIAHNKPAVEGTETEEWEENNLIELAKKIPALSTSNEAQTKFDDELRRVCALAESRGRREGYAEEGMNCHRHLENERERIRRWAIDYNETMVKHYGTDKHGIALEDLLEQLDA